MVHKYLFVVHKEKVSVLSYNEQLNQLRFEKNKGEKTFPVEEKFWEWWIRTASFDFEQDKVDFCFLYDIPSDIMDNEFEYVEKSTWTYNQIKLFFEKMTTYEKVKIRNLNSDWESEVLIDQSNQKEGKEILFYTTLEDNFEEDSCNNEESINEKEDINKEELSPLARLFIEQMEQERIMR